MGGVGQTGKRVDQNSHPAPAHHDTAIEGEFLTNLKRGDGGGGQVAKFKIPRIEVEGEAKQRATRVTLLFGTGKKNGKETPRGPTPLEESSKRFRDQLAALKGNV